MQAMVLSILIWLLSCTLRKLIWLQTDQAYKLWKSNQLRLQLSPDTVSTDVFRARGPARPQQTAPVDRHYEVLQRDMLEVAGELVAEGHRVAVLNMAAAASPGGGFREGAGAQEENLHRRTDLFRFTLEQQRTSYPIPSQGCLLSKDVTIMRGTEKGGYPFLDPREMAQVCVISCAALSHPQLIRNSTDYANESDRETMRAKAAAILQAAASVNCSRVVLSAFGCGAFGNPPEVVAKIFKQELQLSPIPGAVFCIFDDHNAYRAHNPIGNFQPFREVFGK